MKKLSRPQYHRIQHILGMIRQGTRSGHYPNASDFTREMEVTTRTISRDMDFLRDEGNAPIEYEPVRHGYKLTDETWNLPAIQVSRKELFAFSIARKLIERFKGTALETDMESVLEKIADSLEGKITLELESITDRFTVLTEDYVSQAPETWSALVQLLDRQERMKVVYEKFNGEVGNYVLDPYHVISYHGNWYVLANEIDKGRIATFAVSRIRSVTGTGKFFDVPQSFDVQEHIDKSFGIVGGGKVFGVRLLFSKNVAAYIRERIWHPSQQIVEKRDGSLELRFETAGWKELVRWILSWQPDVKVLTPKKLRDRVAEKMRQGLARSKLA